MIKFMKYEIRGTYRFIMMLVLAILGASTGLQLSAFSAMKGNVDRFPVSLPLTLGLVIFGAFITAFFYIVNSFRRELYEDRGYLTFSLPLTGKEIVGTKLLIALLWSVVIGLSMIIYNLILGSLLFGTLWIEGFKEIMAEIPFTLILTIGFGGILSAIISLLLIYFSMTLSKVSIKNKKIGGLWFILFLVLNGLVDYFSLKMGTIFPYYLDIESLNITKEASIMSSFLGGYNISSSIFFIIVAIATFFATSYLIDYKVEI